MRFFDDPEKYLSRTREAAEKPVYWMPEEKLRDFSEIATKRLTNELWQEEGRFMFNLPNSDKKESVCSFEYDSVINEDLKAYLEQSEISGKHDKIPDQKRYRRLKEFSIQNKDGDNTNLQKLFNENSVYIYLNEKLEDSLEELKNGNGTVHDLANGKKLAEIRCDLTTINGIMILFHEAGHIEKKLTQEALKAESKCDGGEGMDCKDRAAIINNERNASAFALKTLRKFFDSKFMNDMDKFGVQRCLESYHDTYNRHPMDG